VRGLRGKYDIPLHPAHMKVIAQPTGSQTAGEVIEILLKEHLPPPRHAGGEYDDKYQTQSSHAEPPIYGYKPTLRSPVMLPIMAIIPLLTDPFVSKNLHCDYHRLSFPIIFAGCDEFATIQQTALISLVYTAERLNDEHCRVHRRVHEPILYRFVRTWKLTVGPYTSNCGTFQGSAQAKGLAEIQILATLDHR
jgi:hypothetical protein